MSASSPRRRKNRGRPRQLAISSLAWFEMLEDRRLLATLPTDSLVPDVSLADEWVAGGKIVRTRTNVAAPAVAMSDSPPASQLSGNGLEFNLIPASGMSSTAITAFNTAASVWKTILRDDIQVNINIDYTALGTGILGQTGSTSSSYSYSSVRTALANDSKSLSDATAVANLPSGPNLSLYTTNYATGAATIDNNNTNNNKFLSVNNANAKALGLLSASNSASDASISFSNKFTWDFDPSNGITAGSIDFVGTAIHEIGHVLGFESGADTVDYFSAPSGGGTFQSLDSSAVVTVLDLYRRSAASESNGTDLDLRADTATKNFSIDGGTTSLTQFATGDYNGDGQQASHWKDNLSIGIMDPTLANGEFGDITSLDVQAFDVIGWDVAMDLGDAPDSGTGTGANNYQTNLSDNGPRHLLFKPSGLTSDPAGLPKTYLGSGVTGELSALANSTASGDSDNGITTFPTLRQNTSPSITVTSTGAGAKLNYFFDFNQNGSFADAGESFSATLTSTSQSIPVTIPSTATVGATMARFRISTAGNLSSTGPADDGEVEDYQVTIVSANATPTLSLSSTSSSLAENASTTSATVLANVTVTDDGIGTNTLALTGADASSFEIVSNQLRLKAGVALNYETQSSYTVTVTVDDTTVGSTPDDSKTYTLSITNVNEFASAIAGTSAADTLLLRRDATGNAELLLNSVLIADEPLTSISSITINAGDGNDTLTVDLSAGNPLPSGGLQFNGGNPTTGSGDSLVLSGGSTTTLTHTFTNASDGSITLAGALAGTITYTGLEPITDNVNVVDRVFTFNGGSETITLTDATGSNMLIDSTLSESVTFANPTGSLTINAGTGDDNVVLTSFDAAYQGDLTVNGNAGNDAVQINGDLTLAANKNLDIDLQNDAAVGDADTIKLGTNANMILSGSGTATLKASKSIYLDIGSSIVTTNGNISLEANQQTTPSSGGFDGVSVIGATIQASGTGIVSLKGKGGGSQGNGLGSVGVNINTSDITGGTSGTSLVIEGTGGTSTDALNLGVQILDRTVTTGGGSVSIIGTGGGTTGSSDDYGFYSDTGTIKAGGAGSVSVQGTGGTGTGGNNHGVVLGSNGKITSSGGAVQLTGVPGSGSGNYGINLLFSTSIVTTATSGGNITLKADDIKLGTTTVTANASSSITVKPNTSSRPINLGTKTTGALSFTDAELDRLTAGGLIIGDATSGAITVSANISRATATAMQLISAAGIAVSGGSLDAGGGTVAFTAGNLFNVSAKKSGVDLVASNVTFASGTDLNIQIDGTTADTQYDVLNVTGSVNLSGADLALTGAYTSARGESFTIVQASAAIANTFNGLAENSTFTYNGRTLRINYLANSVVLTDVTNTPPTVVTNSGFTVDEGGKHTITTAELQAVDAEHKASELTYSVTGFPGTGYFARTTLPTAPIISFTQEEVDNGRIFYQHNGNEVYSDNPALSVRDPDKAVTLVGDVTITITPVNDPPVFASTPITTAPANQQYTYSIAGFDPDSTKLTASISGLPAWLTFTPSVLGGDLKGTPASSDIGKYTIEIKLTDGIAAPVVQTFDLEVTKGANFPPTLLINGVSNDLYSISRTEGDSLALTASATDLNLPGDQFTYSIDTSNTNDDGNDFTIDATTGAISWKPDAGNFEKPTDGNATTSPDNVYQFSIRVTDGGGLSDTQAIAVTVTNKNEVPFFTTIDSDLDRLESFNPAAIEAETNELSPAPANDPNGSASPNSFDGRWEIRVRDEDNENAFGSTVALPLIPATPAQTLTFTISGGADANLFTIANGTEITLTPLDPDGAGPLSATVYPPSHNQFGLLQLKQSFAGPDADDPVDADANGVFEVIITVTDGAGGTATQAYHIAIQKQDDNSPVVPPSETQRVANEGTLITNDATLSGAVDTITATDDDRLFNGALSDTLTYSIIAASTNSASVDAARFAIDATTGKLSFLAPPDYEAPTDANGDNKYVVVINVSDGQTPSPDTQATITVTVQPVNDQTPVFAPGSNSRTTVENTVATVDADTGAAAFRVDATDGDLGVAAHSALTYSLRSVAQNATSVDAAAFLINPSTGELTFTTPPDFENPADANHDNKYIVVARATDGGGLFAETTVTVTVTDVGTVHQTLAEVDTTVGTTVKKQLVLSETSAGSDTLRVFRDGANIGISLVSASSEDKLALDASITTGAALSADQRTIRIAESNIAARGLALLIQTGSGDDTVLLGQAGAANNDFIPTGNLLAFDLGAGNDRLDLQDDATNKTSSNTWTLSGDDSGSAQIGTFGAFSFDQVESISGGMGNDTFNLTYTGANRFASLDGDTGSTLDSIRVTRNANYVLSNTRLRIDVDPTLDGQIDWVDQTFALANISRAFLTGTGDNNFNVSGWTQQGDNTAANSYGGKIVAASGSTSPLIKSADLGTSLNLLDTGKIFTGDGMKLLLQNLSSAQLTDTGTSNTLLDPTNWNRLATFNGGASSADAIQFNSSGYSNMEVGGTFLRFNNAKYTHVISGFEGLSVTGSAVASQKVVVYSYQKFTNLSFDGGAGDDIIVYDEQGAGDLNFRATPNQIAADVEGSGGGAYEFAATIANFESCIYDGSAGNNVVDYTAWPGAGEVRGQNGTGDRLLVATNQASVALNQQSLVLGTGTAAKTIGVKTIEDVEITGDASNQDFKLNNWLGNATLDGGGGVDSLSITSSAAAINATLSSNGGSYSATSGAGQWRNMESLQILGGTAAQAITVAGVAGPLTNVAVFGDAGNDRLNATGYAGPITLNGGAGDDVLRGGSGNDTLLGGDGNDWLAGGGGNDSLQGGNQRDILVGGAGADSLLGGAGEDVLIGGTTNYDADSTSIDRLMAYWGSAAIAYGPIDTSPTFALPAIDSNSRINTLFRTGIGSPKLYLRVNHPLVPATPTVLDDTSIDTLTGGGDLDWFFANTAGAGVLETPSDRVANELVSEF